MRLCSSDSAYLLVVLLTCWSTENGAFLNFCEERHGLLDLGSARCNVYAVMYTCMTGTADQEHQQCLSSREEDMPLNIAVVQHHMHTHR